MDINLGAGTTVITSELDLERNEDRPGEDLFLDGEELKLFRVYVRGKDDSVIMLKVQYVSFFVFFISRGVRFSNVHGEKQISPAPKY